MRIMILATDLNWGLGNTANKNGLPWESIPEDFQHFQKITKEYVEVVMGHTTCEIILKLLGKPLPKRNTTILSKSLTESPHPDVKLCASVDEVLEHLKGKDYSIAGGAQTYPLFIDHVDEVIHTKVHGTFPADCWFDKSLLCEFKEDTIRTKTLREAAEDKPLVTVHYYKRIIPVT